MNINDAVKKAYDANAEYWAEHMHAGGDSAHRFLEKPAMYSMLPNLKGKSVLCLGCGSGEECSYLKSQGAKDVVGIDISNKLLNIAKKSLPGIEFHKMPLEKIRFKNRSFDFAYSSLAMHYVDDWDSTFNRIYGVLKKGGTFLFSTHHPAAFCGYVTRGAKTTKILGYEKYSDGTYKIFGDYFKKRVIKDIWFKRMQIEYFHRPLKDMIRPIIKSGFKIVEVEEPTLIGLAKTYDPYYYNRHSKIPTFIIFLLKK